MSLKRRRSSCWINLIGGRMKMMNMTAKMSLKNPSWRNLARVNFIHPTNQPAGVLWGFFSARGRCDQTIIVELSKALRSLHLSVWFHRRSRPTTTQSNSTNRIPKGKILRKGILLHFCPSTLPKKFFWDTFWRLSPGFFNHQPRRQSTVMLTLQHCKRFYPNKSHP